MKKLAEEKPAVRRGTSKRGYAKKKSAQKWAGMKTKPGGRKAIGAKTVIELKERLPGRSQTVNTVASPPEGGGTRSGQQSGDLQGLSNIEQADSESVNELLEEGNAFEAGVVTGVEDAGAADEREVHTHEVPEDDVPNEYLDKE